MILFYKKCEKKHRKYFLITITIFGILIILVLFLLPSDVYNRLVNLNLNDSSNQTRLTNWTAALHASLKSPLFGFGGANTIYVIMITENWYGDAHNTFLTILINLGLIGLICFLIILFVIYNKLRTNKQIFLLFVFL